MPKFIFVSLTDVVKIHIAQIETFGGRHGIRDLGLLESAIAMPQAQFDSIFLHETVFEMAAAYMYHIIQNHPFLDGNKRTGMAIGLLFLHANGYELSLTNKDIYNLGTSIATSHTTEDQLSALLAAAWSSV